MNIEPWMVHDAQLLCVTMDARRGTVGVKPDEHPSMGSAELEVDTCRIARIPSYR